MENEQTAIIEEIHQMGIHLKGLISVCEETHAADKFWADIARTHFQQGIMALVRSIEKPSTF